MNCCIKTIGLARIDYTAQSDFSLEKGRRCWLSIGYPPGGKDGAENAPLDFFNLSREKLETAGLEVPSRTYGYNGGANPVALAIPLEKASHWLILDLLAQAYACSHSNFATPMIRKACAPSNIRSTRSHEAGASCWQGAHNTILRDPSSDTRARPNGCGSIFGWSYQPGAM
jgi:hypothetical protein